MKENRKNGRGCVCLIPANQRRAPLGGQGCVNCGCKGCSYEDLEQKKETKTESREKSSNNNNDDNSLPSIDLQDNKEEITTTTSSSQGNTEEPMKLKNGCCRECMRAFSSTKKACICQVPAGVRVGTIPPDGCRICKCKGCHPEDKNPRPGRQPHFVPRREERRDDRRESRDQRDYEREVRRRTPSPRRDYYDNHFYDKRPRDRHNGSFHDYRMEKPHYREYEPRGRSRSPPRYRDERRYNSPHHHHTRDHHHSDRYNDRRDDYYAKDGRREHHRDGEKEYKRERPHSRSPSDRKKPK